MGDLLSLPTKNHNLIKFTTHFEQNLSIFQNNLSKKRLDTL